MPMPFYSRKVFVGGLPFDATEDDINAVFSRFGRMTVDWPRRHPEGDDKSPKGVFLYIFS